MSESEKKRGGRPRLSDDVRAQRAAQKRAYNLEYQKTHKSVVDAIRNRSIEKAIAERKYFCEACQKAFSSGGNLKYHQLISKVHNP